MRLTPVLRKGDSGATYSGVPRLFEEFFHDWPFRPVLMDRTDTWRPAVDIYEKEGTLVLRCEVPGVNEKDIDLKLEGNVLTLKGERKLEHDEASYYQVESFVGSFNRSFTLPETVDTSKIRAEYKNGVLAITIPQRPEVQPRAIPVSAE